MTTSTETSITRVIARANVLGLYVGDMADLPADTPELEACIRLGFVDQIDAEGVIVPVPRTSGGCGCGGR